MEPDLAGDVRNKSVGSFCSSATLINILRLWCSIVKNHFIVLVQLAPIEIMEMILKSFLVVQNLEIATKTKEFIKTLLFK